MWRVAVKGVLARKLRLLLTSIAIVLGVGFVSGAFFLTDSLRNSFDVLFTEASTGIDVHIQSSAYKDLAQQRDHSPPGTIAIDLAQVGVPPSVIEQVRAVEGVKAVAGSIFEIGATVLDKHGKPINSGGAPAFGANWVPEAQGVGALHLVKGSAPDRDDVLLDATLMDRGKFQVGDHVRVATQAGRNINRFRISGVVKFGESNSLNGASITVFKTSRAQELFDMGDRFTAVEVQAGDGVTQGILKRNIIRSVGGTYDVITGEEFTKEQTDSIDQGFLGILQNVILGFAAVAVFVGAFTIFNTFTILVGQRTREIGLLRAIGAGRRQVLGIVVLEALVTGVVASTLGIAAGYGIAAGLRELINSFSGGGLPQAAFPLHMRTILVSYGVGVLVTLVASVVPAVRASRLSPLEALRSNSAHAGRGWKGPVIGTLLAAAGSGVVGIGFAGADHESVTSTLSLIGGGFAVDIIGIALLSRVFILPVTRMLSLVLGRGTSGRLATRNVLRNRARSASTASALMIGLALASLVLVFHASLRNTVEAELDRTLGADISVYNKSAHQTGTGFVSKHELDSMARIRGVRHVSSQYLGGLSTGRKFDPKDTKLSTAFDDAALGHDGAVRLQIRAGDGRPGTGILVDKNLAHDKRLEVGDHTTLAFSTGRSRRFLVTGIFEPNQLVGAPIIMSKESFNQLQPPAVRAAAFTYVSVDDGVRPRTVVNRIKRALGKDGAYLEIQDTEDLRRTFNQQLNPVLYFVLAMLGMSLVIALFGIANTLALNVFERTREIGLLRAVGTTRWQIRAMISIEAVVVALFGAIVGIIVGVAAGRALIGALADEGFEFAVSPWSLLLVLLGGFLAGVVASVLPARRASRTDVLQAIASE